MNCKLKTKNEVANAGKIHFSRAFTLVEIIIALGIFSIVSVVALGALIKIIDANRKAQTIQSSVTNLNFALESISREMRVGSSYSCTEGTTVNISGLPLGGSPCDGQFTTDSDSVIAFYSSKTDPDTCDGENLIYAYRFHYSSELDSVVLQKAEQEECTDTIVENDFSNVVDPNVTIQGYNIMVYPNSSGYPLAFVRLSGFAGVRESEKTYFDLQTAVSSRLPNE